MVATWWQLMLTPGLYFHTTGLSFHGGGAPLLRVMTRALELAYLSEDQLAKP
jgi:hypothetical protein